MELPTPCHLFPSVRKQREMSMKLSLWKKTKNIFRQRERKMSSQVWFQHS